MTLGMFFSLISVQNIGAAYRHIQGGLGAAPDQVSWVITSFLIAEVIMLPLSGWLSRAMSLKTFFFMCSMGFILASIFCGLAWSIESMIFFRVFQGFFGGGMMPAMFSTMFTLYPQKEQQIVAIFTGVIATCAAAFGPHMGGWISDEIGWRFVFLITIPFSFLVGIGVYKLADFDEKEYLWNKIDFIGIILAALFLGTGLAILEEGRREYWFESTLICILFAIFIISLILFIIRELTTKNPIVDIRVFLNKNFLICTILVFIWGFIIFASQYLLPVYIARVRELDGTTVASMVYIMGFSQVASGFLALVLFKFFNRRTVAFIGFLMLAIGTWMQGFMISEIGPYEIIIPQIIRGLSAQLIFLPLVLLALGDLKEDQIKNASGLYSLMGRLGSAIGIALSNTLFEYKISRNYESFTNLSSQAISKSEIILNKIKHIIPQYLDNSPENLKMLMQILYKITTNEASAIAFNQIMLLMGVLAFIAAPLIYLVRGLKKK